MPKKGFRTFLFLFSLAVLAGLTLWLFRSAPSSQARSTTDSGVVSKSPGDQEEPDVQAVTVRIEGRVYDKGNEPVPGAMILLGHASERNESESDVAQSASDQTGSYAFAPDRLGTYTLSVIAVGFAARQESISIVNEGTHRFDFCLERLCVVAGRVVAEGGVVPQHLKVRCTSQSKAVQDVTLNLDDSCAFSQAFPPGDYILRCISGVVDDSSAGAAVRFAVRRDNREASRLLPSDTLAMEYPFGLDEGEDVDDLLILLPKRNNRIGGRTLTQHGAPVQDAYLALWYENRRIGSARSDTQGRFLFEHLDVPEGTEAVHLRVVATPCAFDRLPDRQEVLLGNTDLRILIERAQQSVEHTLRGRVVDGGSGQGIAGAAVRRELYGHEPVHSDRNGEFDIAMLLSPDKVHQLPLIVEAEGYMGRRFVVDTDARLSTNKPVVLPLDEADSEISIHLRLPEGVSPEQVFKVYAETVLLDPDSDAHVGSVPLADWQGAGGIDKDPLELSFTRGVSSGEYPLIFNTWYTCRLRSDEENPPETGPKISYQDMLVEDMDFRPGVHEYDVHVSGNAMLELLLPNVPIKEVLGRIWHSSTIVEADSPWEKLIANRGYTQFTYLHQDGRPTLDTSASLRLPALPVGTFMLDLLVRPEHGEPVSMLVPVDLKDGEITTLTMEQP